MARPVGFRSKKDRWTGKRKVYPIFQRTGRVNWKTQTPPFIIDEKYIHKSIITKDDGSIETRLEPVIIGKKFGSKKSRMFIRMGGNRWGDLQEQGYYVHLDDTLDFSDAPIKVHEYDFRTRKSKTYEEPPQPYRVQDGKLVKGDAARHPA
jgi:hypothetical protein